MNLGSDSSIVFEPRGHRYHDHAGQEYRSVSRILSAIEIPFDREGISMAMARKMAQEENIPVEIAQKKILDEWDKKLHSSHDRGNWIHDNLENFHKYGKCDEKLLPVVEKLKPLYENYFRVYTEVLLHDSEFKVAGQCDLIVQRQKSKDSIFDFYDYKTNEQKGIVFDSIGRKRQPWSHYNRYFLPPLDHLEDCNYHRYSLQLSLYAAMAQRRYGIKIGRLALIFIDNNLQVHTYPAAYLKFEAETLLLHAGAKFKPLPPAKSPQETKREGDW